MTTPSPTQTDDVELIRTPEEGVSRYLGNREFPATLIRPHTTYPHVEHNEEVDTPTTVIDLEPEQHPFVDTVANREHESVVYIHAYAEDVPPELANLKEPDIEAYVPTQEFIRSFQTTSERRASPPLTTPDSASQ